MRALLSFVCELVVFCGADLVFINLADDLKKWLVVAAATTMASGNAMAVASVDAGVALASATAV